MSVTWGDLNERRFNGCPLVIQVSGLSERHLARVRACVRACVRVFNDNNERMSKEKKEKKMKKKEKKK